MTVGDSVNCNFADSVQAYSLISGQTAIGPGTVNPDGLVGLNKEKTFSVTVTGTGAVTANVNIECTNILGAWITLNNFVLSGTGQASDGIYNNAPWNRIRANVVSLTGTNAAVSVSVGC